MQARGYVHLDIKLSNVLVRYCDSRQAWHAFLSDFGISRKLPDTVHVSKASERIRMLPEVQFIAAEWDNYRERLKRDPSTPVPLVADMTVSYSVAGDVYDFGRYVFSAILDGEFMDAVRHSGKRDLWQMLTKRMRECAYDDPEWRPTFAYLFEFFNTCVSMAAFIPGAAMQPTGATTEV